MPSREQNENEKKFQEQWQKLFVAGDKKEKQQEKGDIQDKKTMSKLFADKKKKQKEKGDGSEKLSQQLSDDGDGDNRA